MHPEMLRQLIEARSRETQNRARQDHLVRQLVRAQRAHRHNGLTGDDAIPAIPDYVDGSFIDSGAANREHRVPAARNAA